MSFVGVFTTHLCVVVIQNPILWGDAQLNGLFIHLKTPHTSTQYNTTQTHNTTQTTQLNTAVNTNTTTQQSTAQHNTTQQHTTQHTTERILCSPLPHQATVEGCPHNQLNTTQYFKNRWFVPNAKWMELLAF